MLRADFHAHTTYCDGRNSPGEMAAAAFRLGLTDFGLSGHAYFPGWDGGMDEASFAAYQNEVYGLKEEYRGRMNVYLGVELDAVGPVFQRGEYAIGSVHCIPAAGERLMVDESREMLSSAVSRLWKGDWYGLTRAYYELVGTVYEKTNCDWVGHFDLITKFNQDSCLFDESEDAYLEPALCAMRRLAERGLPFEINTGAISRGYRKEPYPSKRLLKELRAMNGRIMINSDSHRRDTICYGFAQAEALAAECGFKTVCVLKPGGGFREVKL